MDDPIRVGFAIDVQEADAFEFEADVLVLKDWRNASRGLDSIAFRRFQERGLELPTLSNNEYNLVPSEDEARTNYVLFIGPTRRKMRDYTDIRDIAYDMLRILKLAYPEAQHMITNLQGVNIGFDDRESLRAMLLGFNDAYESGEYPPNLQHITFVEKNFPRAELMKHALREILPNTRVVEDVAEATEDIAQILGGQASFAEEEQRPEADENTPHIFVAMPFAEEYDDQYYLAIYPAVKEAGYLCIRLDQIENAFTGNIVEAIKERIKSAQLVIALLDGANPNVYLEVGYAWGRGVPTVLVINETESGNEVPFDVRGERLILYKHIYKLKNELTKELRALLKK